VRPTAPTLAALVLLVAPLAVAQPTGREQLREALADYYAHVVAEKLELSEGQSKKLRPRLETFVAAQQETMATSRGLQRRLADSLRSDGPDPEQVEALLRELLDTEAGAQARMQGVRRDLLSGLEPHQQARFLLSEGEYRKAVMRHLRELRSGERGADRQGRPDSPWRREREARQQAAAGRTGSDEQRQTDLRENLTLLLAFQVRNRLQVPLDGVVDLLPRLEAVVSSQLELVHLEQGAKAELRTALEAGAKKSELKTAVAALLDEQAAIAGRYQEARVALVEALDPIAAAGFVQLHDRFRRDAPRRLRMMQRLMSGDSDFLPEREQTGMPMQRRRRR